MLAQVDRQIARLTPETSTLLTAIGSDGLAEGAKNASKDVGLTIGLSRLNPDLVALQAEKAKIAVKAVTDDLQNKIRMELAVAQAQGLHAKEAARRIAGNTDLTLEGLKKPVFKTVAQRAEAIARNEFATAANSQYLQTLKDMEKEDGVKLKKMYAGPGVGDPRISKVCKALMSKYGLNEDQAIALDELFEAGGFKGLAPPAHPRCRHRIRSVEGGGGKIPPMFKLRTDQQDEPLAIRRFQELQQSLPGEIEEKTLAAQQSSFSKPKEERRHFRVHGETVGVRSLDEYVALAHDIKAKPERSFTGYFQPVPEHPPILNWAFSRGDLLVFVIDGEQGMVTASLYRVMIGDKLVSLEAYLKESTRGRILVEIETS